MANLALTFHETTFEALDREGQVWLRAADIARALGYAEADAISRIYRRNADEFSDSMCQTVNLTVSRNGGSLSNETRIFSLRGAHLLGMFARTARAKEFRRWVLDVLDGECGTGLRLDDGEAVNLSALCFAADAVRSAWTRSVHPALEAAESPLAHDLHDHMQTLGVMSSQLRQRHGAEIESSRRRIDEQIARERREARRQREIGAASQPRLC